MEPIWREIPAKAGGHGCRYRTVRKIGVRRWNGAVRVALLATTLLTVGLVGGPPTAASASTPVVEWPQFRGGPAKQGSNTPSAINAANVATLTSAWTSVVGAIQSNPTEADGIVYVAATETGETFLLAYPAICASFPGCKPLWSAPMGGVASSPAVSGGVVYLGSFDQKLYAFDAAGVEGCSGTRRSCTPLWTGNTGGWISTSSPVVSGGKVYVGAEDDKLHVFDASGTTNCTGTPKICEPLWTAATGGNIFGTPAVSGNTLVVGSMDGTFYGFDAAGTVNCSGTPKACTPLWTAATGGALLSSPAVSGGVAYVGSADGKLYAFDVAGQTGCAGEPKICSPLWTATAVGAGSPAVSGGVVYLYRSDDTLVTFDAAGVTNCSGEVKTCTPLWTAPTFDSASVLTSPSVANGLVFTNTGNSSTSRVEAFDAAGVLNCAGIPKVCTSLWNVDGLGGDPSSATVAGSNLYVGSSIGMKSYGLPVSTDGAFHVHEPYRLFDSREEGGAFGPGETRSLKVTDRADVPASGVTSVVVNIAVTQPTDHGYLTVFPSGTVRPLASSINFAPGETISNAVVAKVGANGSIDIFNPAGTTHVVVDIEGWFGVEGTEPGRRYQPVVPARVTDTRESTPVAAGATRTVGVGGVGGVPPSGRTVVVLNVAVTQPTAHGYLTLYRQGTTRPLASSINFAPGQTISNKVVVELSDGASLNVFNAAGSTHVVIDVEGWFGFDGDALGSPFHPLAPARIADTRFSTPIGPDGTTALTVAGAGGVPVSGATAVVLNVAVTQPTVGGYLTVSPTGTTRPLAASINFAPNQTISNLVVAKVGTDGMIDIYNAVGSTHVVLDVAGWFGP
jgi:outer membrane protein assembly factor BamB